MAKKKKFESGFMAILGFLVSLGVAGLFISGTTTNFFLLNYLPLIVHQIVGYLVVIGGIFGLYRHFF